MTVYSNDPGWRMLDEQARKNEQLKEKKESEKEIINKRLAIITDKTEPHKRDLEKYAREMEQLQKEIEKAKTGIAVLDKEFDKELKNLHDTENEIHVLGERLKVIETQRQKLERQLTDKSKQ